jgi:hypothetical protein
LRPSVSIRRLFARGSTPSVPKSSTIFPNLPPKTTVS